MPNRILREGILTSDRVDALSAAEEVFYRRLMSVVDDFGRYTAHPALIRAALYALRLDKVSDSDIGKWLLATEKAGLVRVYPAKDGKRYLEMLDFRQQARAKVSKFPAPDSACAADATQTHSNRIADAPVFGVGDVFEGEGETRAGARPPPSKSKKSPIPPDFAISDRVKVWAADKGYGQLGEHMDAFKRKVAAKGYTYADWDAAFMEAIREDWAKLRGRGTNGAAPGPDVQQPRGRDPTLAKLDADARNAAPPSLAVLEKMAELRKPRLAA